MRIVRDLFTGELKEVPSEGGGRQLIYVEPVYYRPRKNRDPWSGKDKVCRNMSIKPEEATRERIEALNENSRRNGTGAYYTPDGTCHLPTRGSRSREMQGRKNYDGFGYQDNDAGYSDYAGR